MKKLQKDKLIVRHRLHDIYRRAAQDHVIVVTAASGYGKTHSVMMYTGQSGNTIVWITLSELDNIPAHFWGTFCNAFGEESEEIKKKLKRQGFPENYQMMHQTTRMLNEKKR